MYYDNNHSWNFHVPLNHKMYLYHTVRLKWNVLSGPFAAHIKPTHNPQVMHRSYSHPFFGVQLTPCCESSVFICVCLPSIVASGILTHVITYLEAAFYSCTISHLQDFQQCGVSGVLVCLPASCSYISTHSQLHSSNTVFYCWLPSSFTGVVTSIGTCSKAVALIQYYQHEI